MDSALDFRIAFVTTNSIDSASHIARILVSENLASSCTIIPNSITIFSWSNAISEKHECILMIKTKKILTDRLCERISELHNDEVPEIITIKIEEATTPYIKWMESTLAEN